MTKIALITGATSGIGMATAIKLADNAYKLILCGRRIEKLEALKNTLSQKVEVITLSFDVRNRADVESQIGTLPNHWKDIDILVNSAGNAHGLAPLDQGDVADWDAMIDGNVKGLLYVSKAVIPQMVARKTGHIINLGSTAGKQTYENAAVYCASKKAVEAVSEGMRLDLTKHQIKVSNVAPGAVATEFSEVRFKGDKEKANKVYEGYEALVADDVADLIFYIINAPDHVCISDVTIYPKAQAAPKVIYKQ